MRRLETVVVPIRRDYESAYAELSDPRNFPRWSPIPDALFEAVDESGLKWRLDLPRGRRIMHFAGTNNFGVLDYAVFTENGEPEHRAYLRLIPNGDGCTLVAHYLMRPGMTDEAFSSEMAWVATDLQAIAAELETR